MKIVLYTFCFFVPAFLFAQNPKNVDFKTLDADLHFDFKKKEISGDVTYTFKVEGKKPDTVYIDAQNIHFENVKLNNKKKTGWTSTSKLLKLYSGIKKGNNTLVVHYSATPKQTLYFVKDGDDNQIWTQGQGKYTSHWLPSFDNVNEKLVFNIKATYDKDYTVLANGKLTDTMTVGNTKTWQYRMEKPMSSYLAMVAIGKYHRWRMDAVSGTPIELYLREEDTTKFGSTYRYMSDIFDFMEKETGVPYAWGLYRQVPVLDFLYAGMENTTSTIFSQDFVVDEIGFNDRTYMNVNAHELAHQWFGDLITAESGTHHWLQEGFATYYALLAEREIFGDDYFNYEMYEIAERIQKASKNDTIPILNEKASSLSFYQKGAWALHALRSGIGDEAFKKAVKTYLEKYAFKNVNTDQFLAEIKIAAPGYDTDSFKKRWLESGTFQVEEALNILSDSGFMQQYFAVGDLQDKPFAENKDTYLEIMQSVAYYPVKEEILFQIAQVPFADKAEIVRAAMQTNDIKIRQAVARTVTVFPIEFYEEYRSLLDDESYITREIVLNVLYKKFPDKQAELLDLSKKWVGFNDMNLRIQWLTLAYASKTYHPEKKDDYYGELIHYASPKFESSVRQNALSNLLYIGKADPIVWQDLINATTHHKWQFAKFGKDNLRKLLKKKGYRELIAGIMPDLSEAEQVKLQQLLDEK
ncbi:M1 family metallopeptidase [Flavobacterium sp. RHBU_3]|uniref:M1 family metallopeptidase n=1 Tax=Flavobacterium sp. RHBU_3 TaxID=3391184 RepID=UPI003984A631